MRLLAKRSEKGMASLVVTVVLISLLSAIAVSFSVIMNRELQKSVNNQLGQAAYNAAASGINDVISYLRDNPNTNVTQCQDLLATGKPLNAASNISGNGNTKYTCALINTRPHDIVYQSIPANQSQVVKASFSSAPGKLLFSWQSTNRGYNKFVPSGQAGQLLDETTWKSSKFTPMLRVTLYPVPADTKDANFTVANGRTYYLYPTNATGFSVNTMAYSTGTGTLKNVECGVNNNNGQFNGTGSYDCNLILNSMLSSNPAGYIYYIRITPLYGAADIQVRANDATAGSGEVSFVNTQAIIDVTAQSGGAVKRLQSRVDISGLNGGSQDMTPSDFAFPEYALQSANTICKRIQNPGSTDFPSYLDNASIGYCGLPSLPKLEPPIVDGTCVDAGDNTSASCSFNINPNNGRMVYCKLSIDGGEKGDCLGLFPATHSTVTKTYAGTFNVGPGDHTFSLCANNPAGQTCDNGSFNIYSPPAAPPQLFSFTQDTTCVYGGVLKGNCFNFTGSNLAPYPCSYTIDGDSSQKGYSLNADGTAGSFTYGNDGFVAKTGVITCGSASIALNGPPSAPSTINIGFFIAEGPYDNGTDNQGKYCPDYYYNANVTPGIPVVFHQFSVCMRWAITISNAGQMNPVKCQAFLTAPGSTTGAVTNSAAITTTSGSAGSGGAGWQAGSNSETSFHNSFNNSWSAGWIRCIGADGSNSTATYNTPPENVIDPGAGFTNKKLPNANATYNYKLPYCGNIGAYFTHHDCVSNL